MRSSLLAVLALSVAFIAAVPVANAQTGDSVTGQAQVRLGSLVFGFSFDAHSGPSGEQPSGTVNGSAVTCLNVSGNQAIIGTTTNAFFVEDNDSVGQDRVGAEFFSITTCPNPATISGTPLTFGPFRITSGDIVIHDAPPLPASKDQCQNGGWQTFGVFKNQGDCVSFVATGGKNPPAGGRSP
jgi:hypothetical protein